MKTLTFLLMTLMMTAAQATPSQFLYVLQLTPRLHDDDAWTEADIAATGEHFRYLQRAAERGQLILAGRTQEPGDRTRGLVIFEAEDETAARAFMEGDPAIISGIMTATLHPYAVALQREKARPAQSAGPVTGIGGLFFRAADPKALAAWYERHLGIKRVPDTYEEPPWQQQAGPTVFAPFKQDTEYFSRPEQQWMLNVRVNDLDAFVADLRAAGIEVTVDPETYPNGRFARTHDPEGNPIELWEPID